jgi:hypothetical protein
MIIDAVNEIENLTTNRAKDLAEDYHSRCWAAL